jgi:hypothetical protein
MCSSTRKTDGALTATNCPQIPGIINLLQSSSYFQRRNGSDHILIHSINHMMLFFANKNCQELYKFCPQCIKFSIDVYSPTLYRDLYRMPHLTQGWVSVPFPSNIHRAGCDVDSHVESWKRIENDKNYFPDNYLKEKKYSFCFVGNTEVTAKKQKELRIRLFEFCEKHPKDCFAQRLTSHSSNVPLFDGVTRITNDSERVNAYESCKLCFIPGGDFPTRKAFFDSLLSGCIPVIFLYETAISQWLYHWQSKENALQSVIYYPFEEFLSFSDEENHRRLSSYLNFTVIREKLLSISRVGSRLQYDTNTVPWDYRNSGKQEKDAFDVIIDILESTGFH